MLKFVSLFCIIVALGMVTTSCQEEKLLHRDSKNKIENTHNQTASLSAVQQPPPNDIYAQAAVETCNCLRPMLKKAVETDRLIKDNQWDKVNKLADEVQKLRPVAELCSAEIRRKYGTMASAREQKKMLKALEKYCPESAVLIKKTLSVNALN